MKLFVSPHNDDAVLFGAFTLLRERPVVLTVFDSYVQVARGFKLADFSARRNEDVRAVRDVLGCAIQFAAVRDDIPGADSLRSGEALDGDRFPLAQVGPSIPSGRRELL